MSLSVLEAINSPRSDVRMTFWQKAICLREGADKRWRLNDTSLDLGQSKRPAFHYLGDPLGYATQGEAALARTKALIWLVNREWGAVMWKRRLGK